jgi:4'-phosphopantetheinyl transferase EntD
VLYEQLDMDFTHFCSAVFSIKESLFKAVYPHIGQYIEFSDAKMLELDFSKGSFKVELCWSETPSDLQTVFAGHLHKTPGKVTTLIFA